MIIENKILKRGFSISLLKDASLDYPNSVWASLGKETKKAVIDNLVYLKVSPYTMFSDKEMYFNSSSPFFKDLGDKGVMGDIPRIADEDDIKAKGLFEVFGNRKIKFKDDDLKKIDSGEGDGAVLGMTLGKDSLLSYALAKEADMKTKLVFVQDCWDMEMMHKFRLIGRFEQEFKEKIDIIYDGLDDISAYKRINKTNSDGIVGANAMNGYMVMLIPLALRYKADKLIFGNEQNFNDYYINEGHKVYPSYEQSSEWMKEQNISLNKFSRMQVLSLIEPIYNIAEVKVLFNRYPSIAKYQMSCSLSNFKNRRNRWCYRCPMCAKSHLYLAAVGQDHNRVDFTENLFGKEFEELYPLFNPKPSRILEKPRAVRDEQLFAFYLAYKNKSKGYLIGQFKKKFLSEAKEREDELYNKFFGVHESVSIPGKLLSEVKSIYKEEL